MRVVNSDLVIWCLLGNPNELLTYDERGMLRTCSPHIRFILVDCAQSLKECVCVYRIMPISRSRRVDF